MGKKVYAIQEGFNFDTNQKIENIIVDTWAECLKYVKGVKGAKYKSFEDINSAKEYLNSGSKLLKKGVDKYPEDCLHVYVDGSYNAGTEKYAYGLVAVRNNIVEYIDSNSSKDSSKSNIRQIAGELEASVKAVEYAISKGEKKVVIFHDYEGVSHHATGFWERREQSSVEYYNKMNELFSRGIEVIFVKVDSHTGDLFNELVDEKCKEKLDIGSDKTVEKYLLQNVIAVSSEEVKQQILSVAPKGKENIIIAGGEKQVNLEVRKLNFYFFGDIGVYDSYNPRYVLDKEKASEILYLIANNEPFMISNKQIANTLHIDEAKVNEIIQNLEVINAVERNNDSYRVKFPVFLEKDVQQVQKFINDIGPILGKEIISLKDVLYKNISKLKCSEIYSNERVLYHIICDKIFDGTAFEYFGKKGVFSTAKSQPGNRDYIIIAYEESEYIEEYSNKLLCSSNNYRSSKFTFNSFGDSDGSRKDIYRFFRLSQQKLGSLEQFEALNSTYMMLVDAMNKEIVNNSGELMCKIINDSLNYEEATEQDKILIDFLKKMDYIKKDKKENSILVNVPVFYAEDKNVIADLSDMILSKLLPTVEGIIKNIENIGSSLTSVKHGVDIKELSNELWHQIFGAINEYLVKVGFVAQPDYFEMEGRYLKSFSINF
ncbi:hypothetical protein rsdtw13_22160 [Clostridium sp. TW13]|uniref:Uncharacterized protein n=1 Tax=Inconstantimicrobium mannanitabidum TaxID=1604901 RepID=A0ACB5RD32_9CLOT|nr:hypothetical protein rsdtw13_22160 [Clostridium sp. TW13]